MAEEELQIPVPRVKLGTQGLEVSRLGFGCGSLSGYYNSPLSYEEGGSVIQRAFSRGVTFFDTSDVYGAKHHNEILIGKVFDEITHHTQNVKNIAKNSYNCYHSVRLLALKQLPREKIQLATKFGISYTEDRKVVVKGDPEYVRKCCDERLRVDLSIPFEDTMSELKKLVEEGKIKYVGLSEASLDTIRRAHAVHPVTAVQMEWSLWTRDVEDEVVPLCRELGIGIVAYSPLGRGFFAGKATVESLPNESMLANYPRFNGDNMDKNKVLYERVANLASKHYSSPSQLALSWLLHQCQDVVPIPGTTKISNFNSNLGALKIKLTEDDLQEISEAVPCEEVAGSREITVLTGYTWKNANTPPKH